MPKSKHRRKPRQAAPGAPAVAVPHRKILIGIPVHSGKPDYATMVSCANAAREAAAIGAETVLYVRAGDSILIRARDVIFSAAYASDATDLLFVDGDLAWDPGVFAKIMSHHHDKDGNEVELIGGVYCGRGGDPPEYVCSPLETGLQVWYPAGLAEVRGCATGFLRITRAGMERIVRSLPEDHWYYDERTAPGLKIWHLFDFVFDPKEKPTLRLRSEDYVFCDRFRAAGGRVYVDVDLTFHHSGQHCWSGNFDKFLRAGGGQTAPKGEPAGLTLVDAAKSLLTEAA